MYSGHIKRSKMPSGRAQRGEEVFAPFFGESCEAAWTKGRECCTPEATHSTSPAQASAVAVDGGRGSNADRTGDDGAACQTDRRKVSEHALLRFRRATEGTGRFYARAAN